MKTTYGFDPYAPRPHDDGLSTVELDDVDIDNEDDVITILRNSIDRLAVSNSLRIDLYMKAPFTFHNIVVKALVCLFMFERMRQFINYLLQNI